MNKIPFEIPEMTNKTKYYLFAGIIVIVFLLDYTLFMRFRIKALNSLAPEISKFSESLKNTKYNFEHQPAYQKEVSGLREKLSKVEKSILAREEIPMLLENISRLATSSNVQIDQIMPLKDSQSLVLENEDARFYALPIYVKGQGGYHSIGEFFNRIESNQVFMNIEDFDIFSSPQNPRKHIVKTAVTIFVMERK